MTSSIATKTAAIFYQKSEVVQEEYKLIELVTLRETEINYLQKTLIGEVNEGRCKLDDNVILKTFESFNKVRRYTIDLLKGISKWQESFVRPIRPKLLDCDYIIDRLCYHINFINTSNIRKIFNFRFMKGNVLLLPYPSSSKIEPIFVNNELLLQIKEFIQPNEDDIIICYQILVNCLPDDIYKNDVASLKDWLINCWIPRIWTIEDNELFQKKKTKLIIKNIKKNSNKKTVLISNNNYDDTLANTTSQDNSNNNNNNNNNVNIKFQKRVSIIDNYENSNNNHSIAPIKSIENTMTSRNINTSASKNHNNDDNDDNNSINSNKSFNSNNSNNVGKSSRRLSMKNIAHNDSSSDMNNMIHPASNVDTIITTTNSSTNIINISSTIAMRKKKEYEKQLIEISEFYHDLILSIQPPSHALNFKQERITFQLLVSSDNDEPLESAAVGVNSLIEMNGDKKGKGDDNHDDNDDDDDEKDDKDDEEDNEVESGIDVDMLEVDNTTNNRKDKNIEDKKVVKTSTVNKSILLSNKTPTTTPITYATTKNLNKNNTKSSPLINKSILRDVTTPPTSPTTAPTSPSQKYSRRMSDITMNSTTIQQSTRITKTKFNKAATAPPPPPPTTTTTTTTTAISPIITLPNIKLMKSSSPIIKGKSSTPIIKSRRMSELTVTFSNIDGDHGSVYSNSTTTSINDNNNNNMVSYNKRSSNKNDQKIKLKRIRNKKIIPLPSTDLHLSTTMMRVWYANNKTTDDIYNITKSNNTNSSRGSSSNGTSVVKVSLSSAAIKSENTSS